MNLRALVSKDMLLPALVVVLGAVWAVLGKLPFGRDPATDATFLLTTGWIAFAIYLFLFAYMVRKSAHRYGFSPEFRREVPIEQLEAVERELTALRVKVAAGVITDPRRLAAEAKKAIAAARCDRVLRPEVKASADPRSPLELRAVPLDALGTLHAWFRGHLCWGVAALFLLWFHGGGALTSPMAQSLNVFSWVVLGSGMLGAVLFALGPWWLTRRERDLSLEKAFALRDHYRRKLAGLAESDRSSTDAAILAEQSRGVEREWSALARIRNTMHGWRLLHVPVAVALMTIVVVHVVSVIWY